MDTKHPDVVASANHIIHASTHALDRTAHKQAETHLKAAVLSAQRYAQHLAQTEGPEAAGAFMKSVKPHVQHVVGILARGGTQLQPDPSEACEYCLYRHTARDVE